MAVVIYLTALAVWICAACMTWCAAGLMFLIPRTRPMAWPMSLAVVATFPFVLAYQLMATPAVLIVLLTALALWRVLEPTSTVTNPVVIGGFVIAVIVSANVILAASIAGFADGWRTGWGLARGQPIKEMLSLTVPKRFLNLLAARRRRETSFHS